MPAMKRTAIYARTSVGEGLDEQFPDLHRWLSAHPGRVNWYRDEYTGPVRDPPGRGKLLRALTTGRISRIVVWRLDRLGLRARQVLTLLDECVRRDVDLISLQDDLQLKSEGGKDFARWLAAAFRFQRERPPPQKRGVKPIARASKDRIRELIKKDDLSPAQVARVCRVSERTVWRRIRAMGGIRKTRGRRKTRRPRARE